MKHYGKGYVEANLTSTFEPNLTQTALPSACDDRWACGDITDQRWTSSCVAHAISNAIQFLFQNRWGLQAAKPCILAIYLLARLHSGKTAEQDTGCSLSDALSAIAEHGWTFDKVWPWDPAHVAETMDWDVAQAEFDQIGLRWHAIEADREATIKGAVASGLPVIVGTLVDESFQALRDFSLWPGCSVGAGHAMLVVGYDAGGVIVMNSWGDDWGFGGFGRIAWGHICDPARTHTCAVIDAL